MADQYSSSQQGVKKIADDGFEEQREILRKGIKICVINIYANKGTYRKKTVEDPSVDFLKANDDSEDIIPDLPKPEIENTNLCQSRISIKRTVIKKGGTGGKTSPSDRNTDGCGSGYESFTSREKSIDDSTVLRRSNGVADGVGENNATLAYVISKPASHRQSSDKSQTFTTNSFASSVNNCVSQSSVQGDKTSLEQRIPKQSMTQRMPEKGVVTMTTQLQSFKIDEE